MKISLRNIAFELTSVCNLDCKYCYNIWKIPGNEKFEHFNSYKQAKKTLRKLFKIADVGHITFTGGEPFLAERFQELVLYARLKKKSVTIITNGNAGDERDYLQISKLGPQLFEIPFLSNNKKIHDQLTEVKGSWDKALRSIYSIQNLNLRVVAVIVITKLNYDHISETLSFLNNIGIKQVMLNRFNIGGQGIKEKELLLLNKDELNNAYSNASKTAKKYNLLLTSNVCTPICMVNPDDYPNIKFSFCSPDIKKRPLTIDIFGDLRFCNHSPTKLGNIFKDSLQNILQSPEAELWADSVPDYCIDCNLYSKCMAGCRAASEQLGMSLKEVDPILIGK